MDEEILEMMEETDEDDFQIPEFLEEGSEEEIHNTMLGELPNDIDVRKEDIFMTSRDQRQWKYQE